ncbi:MAG: hypothetical protein AB1Z65_14465 [Candidatus Sulfomarinibacteraceae bacterium]
MKTRSVVAVLAFRVAIATAVGAAEVPDTGVSGVYEVMVGTADGEALVRYFGEFGFSVAAEGELSAAEAKAVYGVDSALRSIRLQNGDIDEVTAYYSRVLGFRPENEEAVIDGDWQAGPKAVFGMAPGASHWYRGFVSPNNICGKLSSSMLPAAPEAP